MRLPYHISKESVDDEVEGGVNFRSYRRFRWYLLRPEEREEFKSYRESKYYPLTSEDKAAARRSMKKTNRS
jgi:hypothetical protein